MTRTLIDDLLAGIVGACLTLMLVVWIFGGAR